MLNNIKTNQRGFTIVELLIVIVVIAILAAISIVAYNGIQSRGKTSAAATAAENLQKKIEAYNAINSQYPNVAGTITCGTAGTSCGTQNTVVTATSSDWYSPWSATSTQSGAASTMAAPDSPSKVWYFASGTVGGCIYYWDYQQSKAVPVSVGNPSAACAATPSATVGTFPLTTTTATVI